MSNLVLKSNILDLELILILQIIFQLDMTLYVAECLLPDYMEGLSQLYNSSNIHKFWFKNMHSYIYVHICILYILYVYTACILKRVDMVEAQTRRHSKHKGGSEKLTTDARLLMEERWTIVFTVKYFYQIQRSFKTRYEWYQQACVWVRALCFCRKKAWEPVQVTYDSSDWPQIWLFQGM